MRDAPAVPEARPERAAPTRVVALGASNLTRVLPILVDVVRCHAAKPVEMLAAAGLGRSYGVSSRCFARDLPGIDGCGIWPALESATPAPAVGLVTDVGNDILYGADLAVIVGWVDRALARLRPRVDRLVLTGLPVFGARRASALQFGLVRTLLVPSCRLSRDEVVERAGRLQAELRALAPVHGAEFVTMRPEWYGVDPIHVRPRYWSAFCAELLGLDAPVPRSGGRLGRAWSRLSVHTAQPAIRRLFGAERRRAQPARRWSDGSALSLF